MTDRPRSDESPAPGREVLTVPNVLSFVRLAAAAIMVGLAWWGLAGPFFWLMLLALFTDWVDGRLARWLGQQTTFGARLDSVADASLYAAVLLGAARLHPEVVRGEAAWLIGAVSSYALPVAATLARFRRLPSFHTRAAKTCWFLVGTAAVVLFAGGPPWPLRVAAAAVVATNLEAAAIALVLPGWRTNVPSIYHAVRARRGAS